MPEVIITYETLYELLRKEKFRKELQKLEPDFFKNVVNYLTEKQAIVESQETKDNIFASKELEKTRTQLKNVKNIIKELYEKRESKIAKLAQFNSMTQTLQDTSTMLPEEELLYNKLQNTLTRARKDILFSLLSHKIPDIPQQKPLKTENKTNTVRIKVIQDVPEFVGPDMNVYGPFSKNQALELSPEIANNLINNNQAQNETT